MQTKKRWGWLFYVHVLIMFAIMFGIGSLSAWGQITPIGMKVLCVFIATLYGWLFLDLIWPSLIGLVGLGLTGYMTISEAFSSALSSAMGIQVIITCLFAGALAKVGAVDVVSNWLLTRRSLQKSPWLLITTIFVSVMIGTVLGAGLALILMLWTMIVGAAERCGYDKKDPLVSFLLSGTVIMGFQSSHLLPLEAVALAWISFLCSSWWRN